MDIFLDALEVGAVLFEQNAIRSTAATCDGRRRGGTAALAFEM